MALMARPRRVKTLSGPKADEALRERFAKAAEYGADQNVGMPTSWPGLGAVGELQPDWRASCSS